jgi:hypothetical protein
MCFFHQVNEAAMAALEERLEFIENGTSSMGSSCLIKLSHFERALSKIKPSVSEQVCANVSFCRRMTSCTASFFSAQHSATVSTFDLVPFFWRSKLNITRRCQRDTRQTEVSPRLHDSHPWFVSGCSFVFLVVVNGDEILQL